MQKRRTITLIVVEPARPAKAVTVLRDRCDNLIDEVTNDRWEFVRYPLHLSLPLTVIKGDNGIFKPTAYNRWGVVGGFVVTKFSVDGDHLSLTDKDAIQVMSDLAQEGDGYLNPDCGVLNCFREPFKKHGIPPSGAVPMAGRWLE
jgi:hypothetical protein